MEVREVTHRLSDARLLLEQLRIAARSDGASPRSFATLLKRIAETRAWEHDEEHDFTSFSHYLTTPEDGGGLGLNEQAFLHIAELGAVEELARELLFGEVEAPTASVGRPRNDSDTIISPERGATTTNTIARLKRDDPELAEKVISGEVSANAAATRKGWRRPRIIVSTPERVAANLRKHMTPEQLAALARLLLEDN